MLRRKAIAAQTLVVQRNAILGGRYLHLAQQLRELDALRTEIVKSAIHPSPPDDMGEHSRLLSEAMQHRSEMEASLAREIREMNLETPFAAVSVEAVAAALPQGSVLVEFFELRPYNFKGVQAVGDPEHLARRYIAFVLPASKPDALAFVDIGDADEIDELIRHHTAASTRSAASSRDLALTPSDEHGPFVHIPNAVDLSVHVFAPLLAAIGTAKRLLISPDSNLFLVAFDTLPLDDRRLIIEEYEISYLGTGRDAIRFASPASEALSEAVIVAAPDFDLTANSKVVEENKTPDDPAESQRERGWLKGLGGGFNPLPGAVAEGNEILRRLPGTHLFHGRCALASKIRQQKRPRILHFATHGFALQDAGSGDDEHQGAMFRCGLALAGANSWLAGRPLPSEAENGFLTAEDIATLDLIDTDLAVLSACETAIGDMPSGEGVFGLRRAFTVAGARSVVMSIWKIPDAETQELMEAFYDQLLRGSQRWPGEFEHGDKWAFCLSAAKMPRIRSDNGKTSTPDTWRGLQGKGGVGGHQGREDAGRTGAAV